MPSRWMTSCLLGLWTALAPAGERVRLLVQSSPLAGSQYHALADHLADMQVGDRLELVREPDNPHDRQAIRVDWRGRKLGYVPRRENRILAAALDNGEPLLARIVELRAHPDPWQRLRFEVWLEL